MANKTIMADLLQDKTQKALISMSLPISIGMLSTFLFQVIDTYFVGQLGTEALAALSFSSTLYFLLVGLFIGLSVGVSIIVGQAAGNQNRKKVTKTTNVALILGLVATASLSGIAVLFIEPIFSVLGAEEPIIPLIKEYMIPLLMGMPLLTVGLISGGILRATGNVTKPELLMAVAGVINLVFDYLLIFGKGGFPAMGIQGAAYATVLSWIFIVVGMCFLLIKDDLLRWVSGAEDSAKQLIQEIVKLGAPTILTQIIGPFTLMFMTFLLAQQSSMAVAAFGVAGRIEMLLMIGILGVSTAITPFIAQNSGARQQQRIEEAIAFGGRASTYLGILVILILFIFIKPIAGIFSNESEVIRYTSYYFYIVSGSYILYGLYLMTTSVFNGLQLPISSLKISLVKSFALTLPMTLLGSLWGIEGIFVGLSLSNIAAGLYAASEMRKEFRRSKSALAEVNVWQEYKRDVVRFFSKANK